MKSPAMACTRKAPALKAVECAPGSVGGILTHALVADAGRILAAYWRTATVTTETNVPPAGHAPRQTARTAAAYGCRRVKGYHLGRCRRYRADP
jgi:hypothetical protein